MPLHHYRRAWMIWQRRRLTKCYEPFRSAQFPFRHEMTSGLLISNITSIARAKEQFSFLRRISPSDCNKIVRSYWKFLLVSRLKLKWENRQSCKCVRHYVVCFEGVATSWSRPSWQIPNCPAMKICICGVHFVCVCLSVSRGFVDVKIRHGHSGQQMPEFPQKSRWCSFTLCMRCGTWSQKKYIFIPCGICERYRFCLRFPNSFVPLLSLSLLPSLSHSLSISFLSLSLFSRWPHSEHNEWMLKSW